MAKDNHSKNTALKKKLPFHEAIQPFHTFKPVFLVTTTAVAKSTTFKELYIILINRLHHSHYPNHNLPAKPKSLATETKVPPSVLFSFDTTVSAG